MDIVINPNLSELPVTDYRGLEDIQGGLKTLAPTNYKKLLKSIKERGLLSPFFVWLNPDNNKKYLIDGNQRKRVFTLEGVEPFEVPYILVPGVNLTEAKQNLLSITSQFGTITEKGFDDYIFNLDIPKEWIDHTVNFDALHKTIIDELPASLKSVPVDVDLKSFTKTHVLISFPPEKMIELQDLLQPIFDKNYVEINQSSN